MALRARHNAYCTSPAACDTREFEPPHLEEAALSTAAIKFLVTVLLFLNMPEAKQLLLEHTELARRLRPLGPTKAARCSPRLHTAYDFILIGRTQAAPAGLRAGNRTEPI